MTSRKAKAYATATVLGLGALGGAALGSNPGMPTVSQQASGAQTAVVTSASGATAALSEAGQSTAAGTRAPIVTRASGVGGASVVPVDD